MIVASKISKTRVINEVNSKLLRHVLDLAAEMTPSGGEGRKEWHEERGCNETIEIRRSPSTHPECDGTVHQDKTYLIKAVSLTSD